MHNATSMNDVPGVSPDGPLRGPHGIGDEWISFELRMRRRKLAKCLLRADLAIDDGNIEVAQAALNEARELESDSSEIGVLEARLAALVTDGPPAEARRRRWFRRRPVAVAGTAGFVLLAAGVIAFGLPDWDGAPSPAAGNLVAAVEPVAARSAEPPPPPVQNPDKLSIVYETVRVALATPRIVEELPRLPANPSRPIADAEPQREVVMALNRGTNEPPPPPPETPAIRADLPLETLPNRPVDAPPVRLDAPPPDTVLPASSKTDPAPDPAEPEPAPPRDESEIVRAVLQRYERAYSSLDAAAASAIWPGVNRGALARAFDGLASQRVSLGSCDVDINGPSARATCAGSATWEPKVGGGVRTEARSWNFELKKRGDGWQIERAVTRQ